MFSRWMPPYKQPSSQPPSRIGIAVLTAFALWSLWYLAHHLVFAGSAAVVVGCLALVSRFLERRRAWIARERVGEDIGTFARAFDRRSPLFDPWIVRAVWDALAPWTDVPGGGRFALRPSDSIGDLGCDDEDLDDVLLEAATRARRSLDNTVANPYYNRVVTVADLVGFISRQPRIA